jgi:hypothetical protein
VREDTGIKLNLSRSDVEKLLAGFLTATQGLKPGVQFIDAGELPPTCRKHVQAAQALGSPLIAWSTVDGPIAAWAEYDIEGSKQLGAYLLLIEWCGISGGHHSSWCYCYPKRPTEWIFGRGRLGEPV